MADSDMMSPGEVNHCQIVIDSALEQGVQSHDGAPISMGEAQRLCLTIDAQAARIAELEALLDASNRELKRWESKYTIVV